MADQELSMPQGVATPPAPLPAAPGVAPTEAVTAPQAPPEMGQTTPPVPTEDVTQKLREYEETVRRLKGAQSAADKRAYELQQQFEAQMAQLRQREQDVERQRIEQLPEGPEREIYEARRVAQQYAQQAQQYQAELQRAQWQNHLMGEVQRIMNTGVPEAALVEKVQAHQYSQNPQDVLWALKEAEAAYWREQARKPVQQPQSQPVAVPTQTNQSMPQVPPVTSHRLGEQPPALMETLESLAEYTKRTGESTVYQAFEAAEDSLRR